MKFLKKNLLYVLYSIILVGFMIILALYIYTAIAHKKQYISLQQKYDTLKSTAEQDIQKRDRAIQHLKEDIDDYNHKIVELQKELNDYSDDNSIQKKQIKDLTDEKNKLLDELEALKISKAEKEKEQSQEPSTTEAPYTMETVTQDGMTYLGTYELTAYMETGNSCADGVYPSTGYTVACNDPSLWHRWIYIEGLGTYFVHDTGGMPSYNIIDVYMGTYDACVSFGRQSANVYLLN